jgi:hypothetical protein
LTENGNGQSKLTAITKSGKATNRLIGIKLAEDAIDRALAPKKKRLTPPPDR